MDKEKLLTYFYSNVVTIFWSAFLLFGGGIFVAYFAHIEYMPDFDLKSSVAISAAAAITALTITAVLLVVMVLPGAFWGSTWGSSSTLKNYWTDSEGSRTFIGLTLWFAIPLASIYGAAIVGFFVGWYAFLIVIAVFILYFLFVAFVRKLGYRVSAKEIFTLFYATIVASVIIFTPLWLVLSLSLHEEASLKLPYWLASLLSICFIIFVNVLAATNPKNIKPFYWYLGLSVTTLFVIFASFERFHRVPVRVMELYKFGNIVTTDMILRKDACKAFRALEISIMEKDEDTCVAKEVVIMSRLGREAYLRHGSEVDGVKFIIASSDIISWAIRANGSGWKDASKNIMQPMTQGSAADD